VDVNAPDADDANSALRHVLLWLSRHRADLFSTLLSGVELA
jgi:hypothetical protein